ncbi:MAG: tRNA lysidine(34) synthetase TilS [Cyanobacteriota bacterium]|nr:tRNA lysidine(34) synthetase TilS [Cyanobacteriota bacterium]
MGVILPSDPAPLPPPWGPDHDRLHRHLLRHPALLPQGAHLLLAVSGGQDSMALTGLLDDLRRRHGWTLSLWHGDHGWRAEAAAQGAALARWAASRDLPLHTERADPVATTESLAREWRYAGLRRHAAALGCHHVVTGHTASDRAETLLLHLARGSHRQGLASLRATRPLGETCQLVRPLLRFSRQDTARICQEQGWPVWIDGTNADLRFSRNRLRAEVLPVLEALHPGATTRIAATAERLAEDTDQEDELVSLAMRALESGPQDGEDGPFSLDRQALMALQPANQRRVMQAWLRLRRGTCLPARDLESLLARLPGHKQTGCHFLTRGWQLSWNGSKLTLSQSRAPTNPPWRAP